MLLSFGLGQVVGLDLLCQPRLNLFDAFDLLFFLLAQDRDGDVELLFLLGSPLSLCFRRSPGFLERRQVSFYFLDALQLFLLSLTQAFNFGFQALPFLGLLFLLRFGELASFCLLDVPSFNLYNPLEQVLLGPAGNLDLVPERLFLFSWSRDFRFLLL